MYRHSVLMAYISCIYLFPIPVSCFYCFSCQCSSRRHKVIKFTEAFHSKKFQDETILKSQTCRQSQRVTDVRVNESVSHAISVLSSSTTRDLSSHTFSSLLSILHFHCRNAAVSRTKWFSPPASCPFVLLQAAPGLCPCLRVGSH